MLVEKTPFTLKKAIAKRAEETGTMKILGSRFGARRGKPDLMALLVRYLNLTKGGKAPRKSPT